MLLRYHRLMMSWEVAITLCLLSLVGNGGCQSLAAEEGKPYSLTCDSEGHSFRELSWSGQKSQGDQYTKVSSCLEGGQCSDSSVEFSSEIVPNSGGYRSTLRIKNVTKSEWREWVCTLDDVRRKEYTLEVNHLKGPVKCATPSFADSNTLLLLSCWTEKTYPQSDCKIYLMSDDGQERLLTSPITYHHTTNADDPEYYRSECKVTIPVSSLEPKGYSVKAWIFPKVTGGINYALVTETSESIILTKPRAEIIGQCPAGSHVKDGYIKSGTSATCTCMVKDEGNPSGKPLWQSSNGDKVEATSDDVLSTVLSVSEPEAMNETYYCLAESPLGLQESTISFSPNFAHGPVHVDIQGPADDPIHLCSPTNPKVAVHCAVDVANVKPQAVFSLLLNDTIQHRVEQPQAVNGKYKSNFTFSVGIAGKLSVKCRAANSVFSEQISDAELMFKIKAPPESAPEVRINNGQPLGYGDIVTYTENDTIEIECQAVGGYPLSSNISLTCTESNFQDGNVISLAIDVNRTMNGLGCTCFAQHKTGCYDEVMDFTLNILYPATVSDLNVNDQTKKIEIDEGQRAVMKCFADGNPQPTLIIKKSSMLLTQEDKTNLQEYKIESAECGDTGHYDCEAVNILGKMEKSFDLTVRCPITLQNEISNGRFFETKSGDKTIDIEVDVQGRPPAKDFKLFTEDGETVFAGIYSASSNSDKIFLRLHVDPSKEETYILHAGNGIRQPLKYKFTVGPRSNNGASSTDMQNWIIGGVLVGVILIALITVFLIWRYRKRKGSEPHDGHAMSNKTDGQTVKAENDYATLDEMKSTV